MGPIFASSDRFVIEVQGKKTHGAYPHTGLDPVPVAAELVQALQLVVSRQIDAQSPKVLTIGAIHGGNRFNIIADQVTLEGTMRTLDPAVRRDMKERIQRTVSGVAATHGVTASLRFVGEGNAATPQRRRPHPRLRAQPPARVRSGADEGGQAADGGGGLRELRRARPRAVHQDGREERGQGDHGHDPHRGLRHRRGRTAPGRAGHEHTRVGLPVSNALGARGWGRRGVPALPVPARGWPDRAAPADPPRIRLEDVAREAGLDFVLENSPTPRKHLIETMPGGVAVFDYDGDGRLDVFFTNGAAIPSLEKDEPRYWNRLFRNEGGMKFRDVTEAAGLRGAGYAMAAAVGDYDNDGDADLFVGGVHRQALYRNTGGRFEEVAAKAGVASDQWVVGAGWLDYDNDGWLDLFAVNYTTWSADYDRFCGDAARGIRVYCHPKWFAKVPLTLYRGRGDGTFEDVSAKSGIAAHKGRGMGIAFADYDEDGFLDAYVANDKLPSFLFHNRQGRDVRGDGAAGRRVPARARAGRLGHGRRLQGLRQRRPARHPRDRADRRELSPVPEPRAAASSRT